MIRLDLNSALILTLNGTLASEMLLPIYRADQYLHHITYSFKTRYAMKIN